eukprot:gnl/TRDRNA2_/TRDRNA2_156198_c0_seq1.p1 gnl/TRDRNA2_/TRDRNA2_156198_c0~~gnl/TRDRNA2_/TRDRNA2_156198_c0_seq1.p1  ORF type:complete len:223 (-),score=50.02 gnl/TRDRNA2_/TRDRNA2_156198_c0_seq1:45-713(-)
MYNSLLDGCARQSLVDEGLDLLSRMEKEGINPSNFTLSVLVKLLGRGQKIDQAFQMVDDISKKYRFKVNTHVYNNLIQACFQARPSMAQRAMKVYTDMAEKRVWPDARTYMLMMRGLVTVRELTAAAGVLREAVGVPEQGAPSAMCRDLDKAVVQEVLSALADTGSMQDMTAQIVADLRQHRPQLHIDRAVTQKILGGGMQTGGRPWAPAPPPAPVRPRRAY